jgi:hypothetical protein
MMTTKITSTCSASSLQPIYYFGYGPITHPVVRHRRGIPIASVEAAILYDHRLTFRWGGLVTVVPQRGYEVYGVLLKFDSQKEWEAFQVFDEGCYHVKTMQVYSLKTECQVTVQTFILSDYDAPKRDRQQQQQQHDTLPQERYLTLMADGMKQLGIDSDYIRDQIMSIPYAFKVKPQDYRTFPYASAATKQISLPRYQRLCQNAGPTDVYLVIGSKVLLLGAHDPQHPCSMWIRRRFHGQPDTSLLLHKIVVDPDVTMVDEHNELTQEHYAWAENHLYEYLQQGGLSAAVVLELIKDDDVAMTMSRPWYCVGSWLWRHSHHRYQRRRQRRRNSNGTMSSDASSDVALHRISRTRRSRRIRRERLWNMGSQQESLSSEFFLCHNSFDANDKAADETFYNEEEDHDDDYESTGCGDDEIHLVISHIIVRHDIMDDVMVKPLRPADDLETDI